MKIILNQFIPEPLAEITEGNSDIWKKESLHLNSATVNLVVSESGKGKSSLISSIYGIRKDYYGEIRIDNKDIRKFSADTWSKIRQEELSIVFQSLKLFPELSALDNIRAKNQLTKHKREAEIMDMLQELGMLDFAQQSAASLSFGQQQRIAIIRALCQPFSVLLLDEPFSHLDKENAQIAWDLINKEAEKQHAQIVITGLSTTTFIHPDNQYSL